MNVLGYDIRRSWVAKLLTKIIKSILVLLLVGILLFLYAHIEPYWIQTKNYKFSSSSLPINFSGKKIALISDIHHGPHFSLSRLTKLVDKINQLHPDIIVFTGDLTYPDKKYIAPALLALDRLQAPLGVYLVLGNHDYWREGLLVEEGVTRTHLKLLKNEHLPVSISGQKIYIAGVEDPWFGKPNIKQSIDNLTLADFVILLSHDADVLESNQSSLIDLAFSGHNHGGQVSLFGLYAPVIYSNYGQKFRGGWTHSGNTPVYVSRGIGTIGLPLRFFARPEITLITLANDVAN